MSSVVNIHRIFFGLFMLLSVSAIHTLHGATEPQKKLHRIPLQTFSPEIIPDLLSAGIDINDPQNYAFTPRSSSARYELREALEAGDLAKVTTLLDEYQDLVGEQLDSSGSYSLHIAASRGNEEMVRLLLKRKAGVNQQDDYGCTPLTCATANSCAAIVRLLLKKHADVNKPDNQGSAPLYFAVVSSKPSVEVVHLLLEHGANKDQKDCGGDTPLYWAKKYGREALLE